MAETTARCKLLSVSLLTAFCDPELSRFCLVTPWREGGLVYATDGRIAIELFGDTRSFPKRDDAKYPDVGRMFQVKWEQRVPYPLPDAGEKPALADMRWDARARCDTCWGCAVSAAARGIVSSHYVELCEDCVNGWQHISHPTALDQLSFCRSLFARKYVWLIQQLPNAKAWLLSESMMAFSFDGGRGLLSAMKEPISESA